jgi:hypothetical protein
MKWNQKNNPIRTDIIAREQEKDSQLKRSDEEVREVLRKNYRNIYSDQL